MHLKNFLENSRYVDACQNNWFKNTGLLSMVPTSSTMVRIWQLNGLEQRIWSSRNWEFIYWPSFNPNHHQSITRYVLICQKFAKNIAGEMEGGSGGQCYCISRNFAAQRAAPVFQMEKEGGVKWTRWNWETARAPFKHFLAETFLKHCWWIYAEKMVVFQAPVWCFL